MDPVLAPCCPRRPGEAVPGPHLPLAPQFSLLTGLGALALMVWLTATPHSRETEQKRLGMLAGFAFLTGRWALGTLRCPVGPRAPGRG